MKIILYSISFVLQWYVMKQNEWLLLFVCAAEPLALKTCPKDEGSFFWIECYLWCVIPWYGERVCALKPPSDQLDSINFPTLQKSMFRNFKT